MQSDIEDIVNQNFVSPSRALAYKKSTIVFITLQTNALIKNNAYMSVSARNRQYLSDNEGLTFVYELIDHIDTDTWNQIMDNMHCLPMIPDPANADQIIHQAQFLLSNKSFGHLRNATFAVLLFSMAYRPLSSDIMMYD